MTYSSWKINHSKESCGFRSNKESVEPDENPFHAVYFVDNITGAMLVSRKYSAAMNKNEDLISSFLNAINLFINEIQGDDEEIQEINFKGTRILYERKGRLICIGISKKRELKVERIIMHGILSDFYERFKADIKKFSGVITPSILEYKNRINTLSLSKLGEMNLDFIENDSLK
ncbi:MAG: hypothetical protein ACOC44_08110 [Promethearchaeia archaeon]